MSVRWDDYRREDGTIDLRWAFLNTHSVEDLTMKEHAWLKWHFSRLEILQPINSRQAAAVALANANTTLGMNRKIEQRGNNG